MQQRNLLEDFGLIIHLGLYSVPAYDDVSSARRRRIGNGSEWYLNRLIKTYRRNKGDDLTSEYHKRKYNNRNYYEFASDFKLEKFSAEEWLKLFLSVKAKYIIITAKHHDGFCLWPTKTTEYSLNQDIMKDLSILARKNNIKFGIYYSILEFQKSMTIKYMNNVVKEQLLELQARYQPDIFWFDGDWTMKPCHIKIFNQILDNIRNTNPNILINDRLGKNNDYKKNIMVFADRYIPTEKLELGGNQIWQHINTIGLSWGRNRKQKSEDYKTGKELYELYLMTRKYNGTLCLNLGPNADGSFDDHEVKSLSKFADLIGD